MTANDRSPILYFPVKATPLQMEAGFYPLGRDLGGGTRDQFTFLKDRELECYQQNKLQVESQRHWVTWEWKEESLTALHQQAIEVLVEQQKVALGLAPPPSYSTWKKQVLQENPNDILNEELQTLGNQVYLELTQRVQEDITVLSAGENSALVMGHICTPSFWNPQHVKNASFWSIHQPVPGFPRDERVAQRLVDHIVQRGPFVRFVWTLASDNRLDHHPKHGRLSWSEAELVWYRVERQTTIPLPQHGAIFLIRTYIHPLDRLSEIQRKILRQAIEVMPNDIATYKGLNGLKDQKELLDQIWVE